MGQNKQHLSESYVESKSIFPNRTVVECDETIHIHWRNIRLELSDEDFLAFSDMMIKAFVAYQANKLHTNENQHIELARAEITNPVQPTRLKIDEQINLYKILKYPDAEFYKDDSFIVLRLRDARIEMSLDEFKNIAQCIGKANDKLKTTI